MADRPGRLTVIPVAGVGEVTEGADLAAELVSAMQASGEPLQVGDVLVVSSKVTSKALGLKAPGVDREAAVTAETVRVVAERATTTGVTRVVESAAGPVMAAAGVDGSNTGPSGALLLLPRDPDAVAHRLRGDLLERAGWPPHTALGVVLSDTAGRPWRSGLTDFALGAAGLRGLDDLRGGIDHDGRPLVVTTRAVADEIAAAADLVKGKADGTPAALVRGVPGAWLTTEEVDPDSDGPGVGLGVRHLVRTGPGDWFALGHVEAVRAALGVPPGSAAAAAVGIRPAGESPFADRVARAVALAQWGEEESGADVEVGAEHATVAVTVADPYVAGRLVARLEAAVHAEGLQAQTLDGPLRVALRPGQPAG